MRSSRPPLAAHLAAALATLVALGAAPRAEASALMELLGAASGPHPLTPRVSGGGGEVAYFNPALLPAAPPGLSVGATALLRDLRVRLRARPAGVDVPESIYDLRELLPDGSTRRLTLRPLPTSRLRAVRRDTAETSPTSVFALSFVAPLLGEHLTLGLHMLIPGEAFQSQRPFFVDEREQYFSNRLHFERFGDRLSSQAVSVGLGGRLPEPLGAVALGVGATLETRSAAATEVYIGDGAYQEESLAISRVEVQTRLTPHFGVVVTPIPARLRLTLTAHPPVVNETQGQSDVQFWSYPYAEGQTSVVQRFRFTQGHVPLRVGLGARWSGGDETLAWAIAAEGRWERWSAYVDRVGERPTRPWSDVVEAAASGEVAWRDDRLAIELGWSPSPVPDQVGRENYVDNDRVDAAISWRRDLVLGTLRLRLGATATVSRLLPRSVSKDPAANDPVIDELPAAVDVKTDEPATEAEGLQTNNPGYPGFSSEGWIVALGLWLGASL